MIRMLGFLLFALFLSPPDARANGLYAGHLRCSLGLQEPPISFGDDFFFGSELRIPSKLHKNKYYLYMQEKARLCEVGEPKISGSGKEFTFPSCSPTSPFRNPESMVVLDAAVKKRIKGAVDYYKLLLKENGSRPDPRPFEAALEACSQSRHLEGAAREALSEIRALAKGRGERKVELPPMGRDSILPGL